MSKKIFIGLLVAFFSLPLVFVSAMTVKEGQNINLAKGETINDSVFLAGSNITVNSDVSGDIFVFGQKVYINGNVDGDIIGVGQSIVIAGNVTGSVRMAGQNIELKSRVERSASIAGQDILLSENSFIGRDALLAAETMNINGAVMGNVNAAGSILNIGGRVKNINFYSSMGADINTGLFLTPATVVSGNISYNAFGDIKGASQTNVLGTITKTVPQVKQKATPQNMALAKIGFLVTLLLTTLIVVLVAGKKAKDIEKIMMENVWKSFGIGFGVLICAPILGLILLITGFGSWLGFILIIAWVLMLVLAMVLAGIAFGQYLEKIWKKDLRNNFLVYSLIGALVGYILLIIPFIGFFVGLFGFCWAIGGMSLGFLESRKE